MRGEKSMEVVYSASRNLYPYLPAAYMSVIEHNPDARVWLLIEDEKLPYDVPANVETVDVSGQTLWTEKCANIKTGYTYLSLMRAAYTRLFTGKKNKIGVRTLPYLDKVLQLDVDTIVNENLDPIWNLDMSDTYFGAVMEYLSEHKPFGPRYWNFGVVLFGLDALRRDKIDDEVIADLNKTKYGWIDQDAFCKIGAEHPEKVVEFGTRYNECFCTGQSLRPAIIHYCAEVHRYTDPDIYRGQYLNRYRHYNQEEACRAAGIKGRGDE